MLSISHNYHYGFHVANQSKGTHQPISFAIWAKRMEVQQIPGGGHDKRESLPYDFVPSGTTSVVVFFVF